MKAPRWNSTDTPQGASTQPTATAAPPAASINMDHFKAMARARPVSPRACTSASTGNAARPTDTAPMPNSKDSSLLA
ncbi:hypothetical protein D9M69_669600 [compost metagenome]